MPPRCVACLRQDLVDDVARCWRITPELAARVVDGALAQPGRRSQHAYVETCYRRFHPWWWRLAARVLERRPPPATRRPCRHLPTPVELPRRW